MKWLAALLLALAPTGALAAPKTITRLDAGWQVRIAPADKAAAAGTVRARRAGSRRQCPAASSRI